MLISDKCFFFSVSGWVYHPPDKRGMKKIASRQRTNNVHAELNDDAQIQHLKENVVEVERKPLRPS